MERPIWYVKENVDDVGSRLFSFATMKRRIFLEKRDNNSTISDNNFETYNDCETEQYDYSTSRVYEVGRSCGSGGYSKIYLCCHRKTRRPIALKVIENHDKHKTREISIYKSLAEHTNIVPLLDTFRDLFRTFIVMPFLGDGNLLELLDSAFNNTLPFDKSVDCIKQISTALQYLHDERIVHSDVKLENVLIIKKADDTLILKLCDFGCAQKLTMDKCFPLCGTVTYMAPEMRGGKEINEKVDCWSAGLILFELLTGSPFFDGERWDDIYLNFCMGDTLAVSKELSKIGKTVTNKKRWTTVITLIQLLLSNEPTRRPPASLIINTIDDAFS